MRLVLCGKMGSRRCLVIAMQNRSDCKRYCSIGRCNRDRPVALAIIDGIACLILPTPPGPTWFHHDSTSLEVDISKPSNLVLLMSHFVAIGMNRIDGFVNSLSRTSSQTGDVSLR